MKLPTWITAAATAVVAAALPACDFVNLPEIKPGLTTQAEVRARMGEPGFVHWNDDSTATWEYARQPSGSNCYMITFNSDLVVSKLEQVLNDANYARVREGMSKDDVRRLLGAPGTKQVFNNLREEIWEWRIEGVPQMPSEETYFMVHFDTGHGSVKKTSKRVFQRG
jgi:outer membrane protein assembly factor BamE (lipoprotein component of BamABCDE complex)